MTPEDLLLAPELSQEQVNEFLRPYGFKDPQAADRNLQLIAEDLTNRQMLARIVGALLNVACESPDPDAALNYLERYFAAVAHQANFLGFLSDTAEALEALIFILGTSPFSAEILIRNPEYFYWLLDQLGSTWAKSRHAYLQEARQIISRFDNATHRLHALARFKRREMLRIGARDILKVTDVIGTVTELSNLADAVVQTVYEICHAKLVNKHGVPVYRDQQENLRLARFAILGMGKLGGRELNYSSDIDLIYCHDGEHGQTVFEIEQAKHDGATANSAVLSDFHVSSPMPQVELRSGGTATISNPEFFKKLAQAITHELSTVTEEGYFYRVDLRLRPEGSAGSLVSSLAACKNYYASWGETFERLALIKARSVGGSEELGQEFCEALTPFVFRKFLDFAALEEIQEIKARIDSKLGPKKELNVKLGWGGIREIEFFIQAMQLIYAGRIPALQERNTVMALDKLLAHKFLSAQEHQDLRHAYLFLRDLEHKLQMVFHFQTHELPTEEEKLHKCARRLGIQGSSVAETVDQFLRIYQSHTSNVSRIFQNLIGLKREGTSRVEWREASLVLNRNLTEEEAFGILAKHGFKDLKTAFHQIVLLRDAPSFAHSPSKMRNLLANLMPPLLETLSASPDPDTGLSYFERFVTALGERNSLYLMLNESPEVLKRLIRVLSSSSFLAEFLCSKPQFFDSLVREDSLLKRKSLRVFKQQLRQRLDEETTFQARKMIIRDFQQTELFRIESKDTLNQISRPLVGRQLAALAEACLTGAFNIACDELKKSYGPDFPQWAQRHFAIVALGKLGGNDLSCHSDLDLVYFFSVNDPRGSAAVQQRFVRLAEILDEILCVSRGHGSIYKIDTRLRPEGKKGELVVALHKFQEYLERRAQDWERLAWVRHRLIMGERKIRSQLKRQIEAFVYQSDLKSATVGEIRHIRRRMEIELGREAEQEHFHLKAGIGGLVDIEFATQLLQLKHGRDYEKLRIPSTTQALKQLHDVKIINESQFQCFYEGYEFLRLLENRLRMISPYGATTVSRSPKFLQKLARLIEDNTPKGSSSAQSLEKAYIATTLRVRQTFQEILSKLSSD